MEDAKQNTIHFICKKNFKKLLCVIDPANNDKFLSHVCFAVSCSFNEFLMLFLYPLFNILYLLVCEQTLECQPKTWDVIEKIAKNIFMGVVGRIQVLMVEIVEFLTTMCASLHFPPPNVKEKPLVVFFVCILLSPKYRSWTLIIWLLGSLVMVCILESNHIPIFLWHANWRNVCCMS